MNRHLRIIGALCICGWVVAASPDVGRGLPFPNAGFEEGLKDWKVSEPAGPMTTLADDAATGTRSLRIDDSSEKDGSNAIGPRPALPGPGKYTLSLKTKAISGSGLGIYVRVYDAAGKRLEDQETQFATPTTNVGKWQPMTLSFYADAQAASAEVWIHSYSTAKVSALVDDFELNARPMTTQRPWPGQYKIRAEEKGRLTAADVVGPDGIVYPDFSRAGVPGGIPETAVVARPEQFGAAADDEKDDAEALQRAVEEAGRKGGGAVLLGPGLYQIDKPILVTSDGVVIRGSGQDKTRLNFRYAIPKETVRFFMPADGQTVTRDDSIQVHADPRELQAITIYCDGKQIAKAARHTHWGNTFSLSAGVSTLFADGGGSRVLRAVAEYPGGKTADTQITVNADANAPRRPAVTPRGIGAIAFAGKSPVGEQIKLSGDGLRGQTQLTIADAKTLAAGDRIRLRAPATPRWNAIVQNACQWGEYRRYDFLVTGVEGNRITLNQPLRIDFPIVDGAYVQKIAPIRRCGIEDLTIHQVEDLWIEGVLFAEAWECWAKGVKIEMAGRNPIYSVQAKWCTIRDCTFDDAHYKGGGGTAYAGYEFTCDSLMENITTRNLRHAPLFQWSASGNVIRNSTFVNSDGQWHSGWTNENLFENCTIDAKTGNGAYGYGLWASPPEDEAHGPNGPRNVVYNCDVKSPRNGLWMGGMNENWLITYNRFVVGAGSGVYAKTASFDHIIRGNVFVLQDKSASAIRLVTPDCVGVEMIGNTIAGGSGRLSAGAGRPDVDRDNTLRPMGDTPRPRPEVPSIYEWQVKNLTH